MRLLAATLDCRRAGKRNPARSAVRDTEELGHKPNDKRRGGNATPKLRSVLAVIHIANPTHFRTESAPVNYTEIAKIRHLT